jgi:hypothetical protein
MHEKTGAKNSRPFKGTVSPIKNRLKVVSLDRSWLRHQALTIKKIIKCPFKFLQDFEVRKRLMPNPFEFAASLMNVDSKLLSTF